MVNRLLPPLTDGHLRLPILPREPAPFRIALHRSLRAYIAEINLALDELSTESYRSLLVIKQNNDKTDRQYCQHHEVNYAVGFSAEDVGTKPCYHVPDRNLDMEELKRRLRELCLRT